MKGYLKFGESTHDDLLKISVKGFAFSTEAVLSLLVCTTFIVLLSTQTQENFSDVLIYKQASDILELILEDGSLETHDVKHIRSLLESIGLQGKIVLGEDVVFDDSPNVLVTVHRTMITKEGDYVNVTLYVGKKTA